MGTWGPGAFENDMAADWVWQIEDAASGLGGVKVIESALRGVADLPGGEHLDADAASCALAAAEVIAGALGKPAEELPDNVAEWIKTHAHEVPLAFRELAMTAVKRAVGPDSELAELWAESDDSQPWRARVHDLYERLEDN